MVNCGGRNSQAEGASLAELKTQLAGFSEYSIILDDMNSEGNFTTDYFHKYRVVYASADKNSDGTTRFETLNVPWSSVSESLYRKHSKDLGMVLVSKKDGQLSEVQQPPGYDYVGDSRYGNWQRDNSGSSVWIWYANARILESVFRMGSRGGIYQDDWTTYQDYRSTGRTYYGKKNEYGTTGSYTQKSNPDFFERRTMRAQASKESFRNKVQQRTRRTNMSGYRSRSSGGFGK